MTYLLRWLADQVVKVVVFGIAVGVGIIFGGVTGLCLQQAGCPAPLAILVGGAATWVTVPPVGRNLAHDIRGSREPEWDDDTR